jgi:GH15 family glucan-1,4-alpha-glucosidase
MPPAPQPHPRAGDERLGRYDATEEGSLRITLGLQEGQVRGVVLETGPDTAPRVVPPAAAQRLLDDTAHFWHDWGSQSTGCATHPSRFTRWFGWVSSTRPSPSASRDRITERRESDTGPLDIMYRVDGSPELHEEILPDWEGYRGSYPVRIGNGAAGQRQLDIYGEALDAFHYIDRFGVEIGQPGWLAICELLEWLADNWDQPEEGIWETRGGRKDFTYGRLMCWVAFDRAIRLATAHGRPAPLSRWMAERDAIYNQIMDKGWSVEREAFVQQYGDKVLTPPC